MMTTTIKRKLETFIEIKEDKMNGEISSNEAYTGYYSGY